MAITCFAFFSFVPLYTLMAWQQLVPSHLFTAPLTDVMWQALFQGGGSVVISGITFTQMIRHYGPVRSTMITAVVPGLSALAATWLLAEPLHWNVLLGLVLVCRLQAYFLLPPCIWLQKCCNPLLTNRCGA
jgi:drug/metabolite transporter (DMT)-like permease